MGKNKGGRPPKILDHDLNLIKRLYALGVTDEQAAKVLGVQTSTIYNWRNKYPEFLEVLKKGKEQADLMVEASLFQRAVGYNNPEEHISIAFGQVTKATVLKHYPPDPISCIFWLKNRQPDKWNVKPRDELTPPERTINPTLKRSFTEFCIEAGYPPPYQKQIDMYEFGINGSNPRMILGARGYGKTDYITILGTAYDIYLKGVLASHLIISKSKNRNSAMIAEIANALIKNGVELDKQNSTCIRVKGRLGKDHSVEAITIKTSMRGRHPDNVTMDDPVTEEDVSEAMRLLVKRKYNEVMKLCQNVCVIGQPAHAYDLYAELRPLVQLLEVPHGTIPELDHDLEAQRLAGVDENSISASYFLKVISDGGNPFEKIRYIDAMPIGGSSVAFIDPSFKGGDYTSVSIIKGYGQGVAVVGFVYKKAWNHCIEDIAKRLVEFGVKRVCFETNSLGDQPIQLLRGILKDTGIGVVGKDSNTNKHSRILGAGTFAEQIHLSQQSDRVYIDQVVKYEYGAKHDDAPDSLASGLEWIGLVKGRR